MSQNWVALLGSPRSSCEQHTLSYTPSVRNPAQICWTNFFLVICSHYSIPPRSLPAANVGYTYNTSIECGGAYPLGLCYPCQNTGPSSSKIQCIRIFALFTLVIGALIRFWLRFTPEFQISVIMLSSPVALAGQLCTMMRRLKYWLSSHA
jgi:hypothetical protein